MSRSNYKKIINFGHINPKNPLEVCFGNTINNKFEGGVLGDVIGGQFSRNCQLLLAEYCGNNWDGYCELASKNINNNYPNLVMSCSLPTPIQGWYGSTLKNLTAGQILIRNAAFKRFFKTPNCMQRCESFDPTNPLSPKICYAVDTPCFSTGECTLECDIGDIAQINRDRLFLNMLENPSATLDILICLYQDAKAKGKLNELMQTNFGKFIAMNSTYFQ
jgi:hypothetical protein